MSNFLYGISNVSMLASSEGRIFGLDSQLVVDVIFQALAVFILFIALSYILFNPVRKVLDNRKEKIKNELENASNDKESAAKLRAEYEAKLKNVNKEAEEILSQARKKALKKENDIIDEAKNEANRIITRANTEIELEKNKIKDEVKQEIIKVSSILAGKIIATNIDESVQERLLEDTLKEMGDDTWLSK